MNTKIKDIKGIPNKVHYLRYAINRYTVTTQCNKTFKSNEWNYTNGEVNCPNCLLATIKKEKIIKRQL